MRTFVGIALVALALGAALWWFTAAAPGARGARAEPPSVRATPTGTEEHPSELGSIPVVDELAPIRGEPFLPASTVAVAPSSSREPASRLSSELTPLRWVEGRVVIPAGTPADEKLFVIANERASPRAIQHRVAVAPGGSFRVAFQARTITGYFELEARYLYLERRVRWRSNGSTGALVLEPLLGARIAGRVIVPDGTDPGSVGGVVELRHHSTRFRIGRREITATLAFDFLVPSARIGHSYELHYDGARFVGDCRGLVPEAGRTLSCELLLRPGVTLAGVVRDSTGQPMAGVPLTTLPAHELTSSADDGTFQLVALEAGKIELSASTEGMEEVRLELGELVDGTTLTGIEFVVGVGQTISGVVRWPDGAPAKAAVDLWAEGSDPANDRRVLTSFGQSAPDGRFSIGGLTSETYRIQVTAMGLETVEEAKQRRGAGVRPHFWIAELRNVPAGTNDLVFTLSLSMTFFGIVTDGLGAPVTDFRIEVHREEQGLPSMRDEGERVESFRTPDGTFRIERLTQGEWSLLVRSEGYSDLFQTVTLPTTKRLQLVLTR